MNKAQCKLKKFDRANYPFQQDTQHAETIPSQLTPKQVAAKKRSDFIRDALKAEKAKENLSPESKEFYGLK